jgi:uncharacterized membrane protein
VTPHGQDRRDRSGFRWRSHEITRIEGFSEAVFAFAVTLLVVSLEVPRTFDELAGAMHAFVAFALGSALLFVIWYNQYRFFRRYGLQDGTTIVLNGALLFVVLFFVYPLKFLFAYLVRAFAGESLLVAVQGGVLEPMIRQEQTATLMLYYGAGYVAVFGIFLLLYVHVYRRRGELELAALEAFDTRAGVRENAVNVVIGLLSVTVILLTGRRGAALAGWTDTLIAPAMALHGGISGRFRKRHLSAGGTP